MSQQADRNSLRHEPTQPPPLSSESNPRNTGARKRSRTRETLAAIAWAVAIALLVRTFALEAFKIPSGSMVPTLRIGDYVWVNKLAYGIRIPFSSARLATWGAPGRGDVIVFSPPEAKIPSRYDRDTLLIKRVVAIPGDRIRLVRNRLYLNGQALVTRHLRRATCDDFRGAERCSQQDLCQIDRTRLDGRRFDVQYRIRPRCYRDQAKSVPRVVNTPNFPTETSTHKPFRTRREVTVPRRHVFVLGDNRDYSEDSRYWGFVPHRNILGRAFAIWWSKDPEQGPLAGHRWDRLFKAIH